MSKSRVRINLKAFDNKTLDLAAGKIVDTVKRLGGKVSGPVPLPTEIERLIDIAAPSKEIVDALTHLDLPSGVDIDIKL